MRASTLGNEERSRLQCNDRRCRSRDNNILLYDVELKHYCKHVLLGNYLFFFFQMRGLGCWVVGSYYWLFFNRGSVLRLRSVSSQAASRLRGVFICLRPNPRRRCFVVANSWLPYGGRILKVLGVLEQRCSNKDEPSSPKSSDIRSMIQ